MPSFIDCFKLLEDERRGYLLQMLEPRDVAHLSVVNKEHFKCFGPLLPPLQPRILNGSDLSHQPQLTAMLGSSDTGDRDWAERTISAWLDKQDDRVGALERLLSSSEAPEREAGWNILSAWLQKHPQLHSSTTFKLMSLDAYRPLVTTDKCGLRTLHYPQSLRDIILDERPSLRRLANNACTDFNERKHLTSSEVRATCEVNQIDVAMLREADGVQRIEINPCCRSWLTTLDKNDRAENARVLVQSILTASDDTTVRLAALSGLTLRHPQRDDTDVFGQFLTVLMTPNYPGHPARKLVQSEPFIQLLTHPVPPDVAVERCVVALAMQPQ